MKHNKGFALVGIIIAIIAVLVVGGVAYYTGKNSKTEPVNVEENQNSITNNSNANIQQVASSNKLFDFFDTFTANKDMGTPQIEFIYPEQHLILLEYPTSQETGAYAVYDYQKDILYKSVGDSYYPSGGRFPVAFVGTDTLLMYNVGIEEVDASGNPKGDFVIQDFNNKIIKTIMTDVPLHEVYPKYGKVIVIDTNTKDEGRFILDSETLELSPWKR